MDSDQEHITEAQRTAQPAVTTGAGAEGGATPQPITSGLSTHLSATTSTMLLVAIVLVVGVLALLYIWGSKLANAPEFTVQTPSNMTQDATEPPVTVVEEMRAIDEDLDTTTLESFDADMAQVDAELDAALAQ